MNSASIFSRRNSYGRWMLFVYPEIRVFGSLTYCETKIETKARFRVQMCYAKDGRDPGQ